MGEEDVDLEEQFESVIASAGWSTDLALLLASGSIIAEDGIFAVNLNDTLGWACADCEPITPEQVPEVATLIRRYGMHGAIYWACKVRGGERSEFKDVNRWLDFVAREEAWRASEPSSSKRAYTEIPDDILVPAPPGGAS